MESVHAVPEDAHLPALKKLIRGRPASWQGLPVAWRALKEPVPVFVTRMKVPTNGIELDVFLFGARYDLSEATVGGEDLGSGHFVEYFVAHESDSGWRLHRLLQHVSVTYSARAEPDDYLPAADVDATEHSIHHLPQWEQSEAFWPISDGCAMSFVGQVTLPETDVTRALLTWAVTLYLFSSPVHDDHCFKLVQQEQDVQSARLHYSTEQ